MKKNKPELRKDEMRDERIKEPWKRELFEIVRSHCCCGREYCYPEDDYQRTDEFCNLFNSLLHSIIKEIEEEKCPPDDYEDCEYCGHNPLDHMNVALDEAISIIKKYLDGE